MAQSKNQKEEFQSSGKIDPKAFLGFSKDPEDVKEMEALLKCVVCKKLPNPKYFLECETCGKLACGGCMFEQIDWGTKGCCNPGGMKRGSSRFLGILLGMSKYECDFKNQGCEGLPTGFGWERHQELCEFSVEWTDDKMKN